MAGIAINPAEVDRRDFLQRNPAQPFPLLDLPLPLILLVLSHLDLPDLATLTRTHHPFLMTLSRDSVLHRHRLLRVKPLLSSHLTHRPRLLDLAKAQTCYIKGLSLTSRIARGAYLGSPTSQTAYESARRVNGAMLKFRLGRLLARRPPRSELASIGVVEAEELGVSPPLVAALRSLSRSQKRDALAKRMREGLTGTKGQFKTLGECVGTNGMAGRWRDESDERVRLALCPGIKSNVRYFEALALRTD